MSELYHYGRSKRDGAPVGSGRYPLGSGQGYTTKASKKRTSEDWAIIEQADKENKELVGKISVRNIFTDASIRKAKLSRFFESKDNSGIPLKKKMGSKESDLHKVNPGYNSGWISTSNNCALCSIAYDMRRRGYDVIAKQKSPISILYDIGIEDVSLIYKNAKKHKLSSINDLSTSEQPNGSRGIVFVSWRYGSGGHVANYEIENGKPVIYDAQSGNKYNNPVEIFHDVSSIKYMRTDNLKINKNMLGLAVE